LTTPRDWTNSAGCSEFWPLVRALFELAQDSMGSLLGGETGASG
jgi:hypothetical protein